MNPHIFNAITGRLSLRPPQRESLLRLARALDAAPAMLEHAPDLDAVLTALKAEFPTLQAFSVCQKSPKHAAPSHRPRTSHWGAFIGVPSRVDRRRLPCSRHCLYSHWIENRFF